MLPRTATAKPDKPECSIAVIGGGISGLAAAHRLMELRPRDNIVIFEASDRLGGVLRTERRDGFLLEHAADNFITTPSWGVELCNRIGFEKELIPTNESHRRAFVVRKGKLQPIPAGFAVMAPSRIWPIASTPILSLLGKARMAGEVFVPRRTSTESESLASFVRRRLGSEVYDRLVQPLLAGIYTGDPEQLSVAATMPRFLEMEKEHGSLVRAIWKQRKVTPKATKNSSGARYSQFVAPREGMSAFVSALVDRLKGVTIHLDSPIRSIELTSQSRWRLSVGGHSQDTMTQETMDFDGLVLATPAHHAASLLRKIDSDVASDIASDFDEIKYGNCAIVSLGFSRDQIGHALDGFGFVVPAIENRQILSCSFSSIKYAGRAPEGHVLLRVFVGGALQQDLVDLDDEQLQAIVLKELADLLAVRGEPKLFQVARQIQAMPQYYVGHEHRVVRMEEHAAKLPNFAIAGNALSGIGIPNCIHVGEKAAQAVAAKCQLSASPSAII